MWPLRQEAHRALWQQRNSYPALRLHASDPENRLVTSELERRWNEGLVAVRALEEELFRLETDQKPAPNSPDRDRLLLLGEDLARAWNNPDVANETRKKIVRPVDQGDHSGCL